MNLNGIFSNKASGVRLATIPPFYGILEKDDQFIAVEVEGPFTGDPRETFDEALSDCWHHFFGEAGMMPLDE